MTIIDYFAWIVLVVIVLSAVARFIAVAMLPGRIAKKRRHPRRRRSTPPAGSGCC